MIGVFFTWGKCHHGIYLQTRQDIYEQRKEALS